MPDYDDKDLDKDLDQDLNDNDIDNLDNDKDSKDDKDKPNKTARRIGKLTKNWRESERQRESDKKDAETYRKDSDEKTKLLQDHITKLISAIDDVKDGNEKSKYEDGIKGIDAEIDKVDAEIAAAVQAENYGLATTLQSKARNLERKRSDAKDAKPKAEPKKIDKIPVAKPEESEDAGVVAVQKMLLGNWKKDHSWYKDDEKMRRYVDNVGVELAQSGKYSYTEVLDEAARLTEEAFEYDGSANFSSVESGSYGGRARSGKITELSATDKTMADKMGIAHKDYLKTVQFLAGGKK